MILRDDIRKLAAAFRSKTAALTQHRHGLSSRVMHLQAALSGRSAGLTHENRQLLRLRAENDALRDQVAELSRCNREIALLGRMTDFLQSCATHGVFP